MEENDALWQLLGESPRPEPDAWFAARTLARCRHAGPGDSWWLIAMTSWRRVLGTGLGIGLAAVLLTMNLSNTSAVSAKQENVQDAFAIMASLDTSDSDSTSSSSSSSWQDQSL